MRSAFAVALLVTLECLLPWQACATPQGALAAPVADIGAGGRGWDLPTASGHDDGSSRLAELEPGLEHRDAPADPRGSSPRREDAIPAAPVRWVHDEAAFLSNGARRTLDAQLEAYQQRTGHQLVVWIGRSTGAVPIEDFAVRAFNTWKVGRKGYDDGIVMFIMVDDHRIDIEVGYGLEPSVPDAAAKRIIDELMIPRIRAGDRDGAVREGVAGLMAAIEGRPQAGAPAAPDEPTAGHQTDQWTVGEIVVGVVAALLLLVLFVTHPRLAFYLLMTLLSGGRKSGRGGGFKGGGGRSGGGGARGSW